ncbi:MAG TPA: hypothetical protein VFC19_25055 [Candidatus Limnocylindrales bacterium]|nr:hypothetical protein [Candidatus Limnocylindrales bacterium]
MHSEDQPPTRRPTWQIWTIVGGAAALLAIAGIAVIVAVAKHGAPEGTPSGPPAASVTPVDRLRSHLPKKLKAARECTEASPRSYSTATITCTWPSSEVPHTATYSLFADGTSMDKSALLDVRDSGYGPSCQSAGDFSGDGGQMSWQRDDRERGKLWCFLNEDDEPMIVWTDTTPKILASAVAPARSDAEQLLEWFRTTGQASLEPEPLPPAPTGNSPGQPGPTGPGQTGGPTKPGTTGGPNPTTDLGPGGPSGPGPQST